MSLEARFSSEYKCPKCHHVGAETDRIAVTGSGFSRYFDVQNRRFLTVSCTQCGYTEFYNLKYLEGKSLGSDIIDLLFGG